MGGVGGGSFNMNSEISRRRTFAIISHPDAGKTTLTEKLLLFGGQIQVAGAVKNNKIKKTATSDWMDIEKQRGISVTTSVMEFDYAPEGSDTAPYKVNILDTPGHQDFAEDTFRTLTAVDSAIIVVDGAKGVEAQTRKLMTVCRMRNTPVIIFINKMDREGKDPFDLLDELEKELGIETYMWWNEALHGYNQEGWFGIQTDGSSYPSSYSMGASWDVDLYYQEAVEIGAEIRERVKNNRYNLTMFSPNINLARDPRWGRNDESYGEDPLVVGKLASAFVNGVEGKTQDGTYKFINENGEGMKQAVTTIKHYAANNSEKNRYTSGADNVTVREMREYYTRAPRIVIQDADVSSVMMAYSSVSGVPISFSSYYMDTLLRQTFGFSGHITSDCDSTATQNRHGYVNPYTGETMTDLEALAGAMAHGEDLECNGGYSGFGTYSSKMTKMLDAAPMTDKGTFTENSIDVSVHRLMTARIATGEFDEGLAYTAAAQERIDNGEGGRTEARLSIIDEMIWRINMCSIMRTHRKCCKITNITIFDSKYHLFLWLWIPWKHLTFK